MSFGAKAVLLLCLTAVLAVGCLSGSRVCWFCGPLTGLLFVGCYSLGGYSRFAHCSKLSCGARYVIMVSLKTRGGPKTGRVPVCMACAPMVLVQLMRCKGLHQYRVARVRALLCKNWRCGQCVVGEFWR